MKKIASILLVAVLVALCMATGAFAEETETPQIVISGAEAAAGEEVILTVSLVNNPGITNGYVTITYDEEAFELIDVYVGYVDDEDPENSEPVDEDGEPIAKTTWKGMILHNGPAVSFTTTSNTKKDHLMFEIVLKVKDNAVGSYEIGLITYDEDGIHYIVNNAEEQVNFEVVPGVITVAHDCQWEPVEGKAADCTNDGVKAHEKCSICGKLRIDGVEVTEEDLVIEALGHKEETYSEHEDPTCTEPGYDRTVVYCGVCGEEFSDETVEIPATGHTHAEAVKENEKAPTCTEDGSYDEVVYCSVCKVEVSRETKTVAATGHTPAEAVKENVVEATCTTDGSYDEVVYCSVCGEELSRETKTVAAGHTPAEPVKENEVPYTCTTDGSYESVVYCSVCGEELSRETVVVPAAHTYVDGKCACGAEDPNYVAPPTGDAIYVAVATALVSMMSVVALTKKKEF